MPRKVRVSLRRWKSESSNLMDNNFDSISEVFEHMKLLYPELGKLHPDLAVQEFVDNVDEFWIISLDVYNESTESSSNGGPPRRSSIGKTDGEMRYGLDTLLSFPAYPSTENNNDDTPSDSGSTSKSNATISHSIPTLATPKPDDKIALSKAPIIQPVELPPLFGSGDPEDLEYDDDVRHRLANGIVEQHVVGLAFGVPSTINIPGFYKEIEEDSPGSEVDSGGGCMRVGEGNIKSYDIGLVIQLDPIRERLFDLDVPCLAEDEEDLTKDAIFQLLLDLESVIEPSTLQFQTTMLPSVDWLHDKILNAFISLGFFREGKGKVLNFRGYEELVTVLSMRMGEWELYKHKVRETPEPKKNKGKGKGKERSVAESSHLNLYF